MEVKTYYCVPCSHHGISSVVQSSHTRYCSFWSCPCDKCTNHRNRRYKENRRRAARKPTKKIKIEAEPEQSDEHTAQENKTEVFWPQCDGRCKNQANMKNNLLSHFIEEFLSPCCQKSFLTDAVSATMLIKTIFRSLSIME